MSGRYCSTVVLMVVAVLVWTTVHGAAHAQAIESNQDGGRLDVDRRAGSRDAGQRGRAA